VVLLYGTPGSIDDWAPVRDELRGRYRVVTVERPGMGWSDPPPTAAEYSLGTHAARIASVLAQLGVRAPILVGWSYGGAVALRMAVDRPELPAGVLHLCGVAPGFVDALRRSRHARLVHAGVLLELPVLGRWISEWIVPPLLSLVGAASWLAPQFGPDWPRVPSHWVARRLRSLQTRHALRSSRRELVNLSADLAALGPRLGEIRHPVRVVVCELDNLVPGRLSDHLVATLPDARKVTVPGAGHSFHVVRPGELGQVIDAFAAELE
jgi:pimeloyl-ACP methyl ester carboxylesterase